MNKDHGIEIRKLDLDQLAEDIASGEIRSLVGTDRCGRPILYVEDPSKLEPIDVPAPVEAPEGTVQIQSRSSSRRTCWVAVWTAGGLRYYPVPC